MVLYLQGLGWKPNWEENQKGKNIKTLRTDNGTEYELNEFNEYCKEASINMETTIVYNREQNGVAERKNKAIL